MLDAGLIDLGKQPHNVGWIEPVAAGLEGIEEGITAIPGHVVTPHIVLTVMARG